jgi:transcriptional regulator with XRE-family HTH domain
VVKDALKLPFQEAVAHRTMRRQMPTPAKLEKAREIGERIRTSREGLGWTQDQLARRTNNGSITGNAISRWERGAVLPRTQSLEQLAEAMGLAPGYLIFGSGGQPVATAADPALGRIEERLAAIDDSLRRIVEMASGDGATPAFAALAAQTLSALAESHRDTKRESRPRSRAGSRAR